MQSNTSKFLISVSINVVLVLLLVLSSRPRKESAPVTVIDEKKTGNIAPSVPAKVAPAKKEPLSVANHVRVSFTWADLESSDYHEYIRNLRAVNCPEETVKDIIIAEINKLFAAKKRALLRLPPSVGFWQPEPTLFTYDNPVWSDQVKALDHERKLILEDLLGPGAAFEQDKFSSLPETNTSRYGFLDPMRANQLRSLIEDYKNRIQNVDRNGDGTIDADEAKTRTDLQDERDQAIRAMLSASEHKEYLVRNSETSSRLRNQLASFEATEQEFRAIFDLESEYDAKFRGNKKVDVDFSPEERSIAGQKLSESLRNALGDRFQEYEQTRDGVNNQVYLIGQKFNLPKENQDYILRVAKELQTGLDAVNRIPDPAERERRKADAIATAKDQITKASSPQVYQAVKSRLFYFSQ